MEKLRIFFSGIDDEMQPEIDAVSNAVDSVEVEGVYVEPTVSRDQTPRAGILEQLEACSVYVGIFSHRYGWIAPGDGISATEFEFNRARELQKPILVCIRKLRKEEMNFPEFVRQESFLKLVRESSENLWKEFGNSADLQKRVADSLRMAYLNSQLQAGHSFEEVLADRWLIESWAEAFPILVGINDRPADLIKWLSLEVQRKNDWRRVLLVKRCWEMSAASDDPEARAAVIEALLVGFADGVSDGQGRIGYRGIDPHVRRLAIRALASIGEPALERLIDSLNEGLGIGAGAAEALEMIGDERAVEPLIAALANENWADTRRSAATALGSFRDLRATKPLFALLSTEHEDVNWAVAGALGKIGDRDAVEPLIELLEGQGEQFSWLNYSEPDEVEFGELMRTAPLAAHLIGNPLTLGSDELRKLAAYSLGKIGDERAVKPLIASLKYRPDEEVRWRAAEALGEIGDKRSVDPLIDALSDAEADVRWSAAVALGRIGSQGAMPELQRVVKEDDARSSWGKVAEAAKEAIEKISRKPTTPGKVIRLTEESPVKTLYKYLHADRIDVLTGRLIRFTQASCLNDTFELFPTIDSYFWPLITALLLEWTKSTLRSKMLTFVDEQLGQRAYEIGLPATLEYRLQDESSDLVEDIQRRIRLAIRNQRFSVDQRRALVSKERARIDERFGVISLAERADNLLMWSHYADAQRGLVLEFDATNPFFDQRTVFTDPIRRIRRVLYQTRRPARGLFDLKYWLRSKRTASEDLLEYTAALFLLTKSSEWAYEEEWRMILPLSQAEQIKRDPRGDIFLFSFPPQCIRAVILGSKISDENRREIMDALKDPDYSHIELRKAHMDSNQYCLVIKDDESVLEAKLLKDIGSFPGSGIQERLKRLQVSSPRLYSAIDKLSKKDLISSISHGRPKQKRVLKLTNAGQSLLDAGTSVT